MVGKVCTVSDVLASLLNAQLDVGLGKPILWREVIGNPVSYTHLTLPTTPYV